MSAQEFEKYIIEELDLIFDGKASENYLSHITQDWSKEAFAKGAYVSDYASAKNFSILQKPIQDKIYFAGDSYTNGKQWGYVPSAIQSAVDCVDTFK